MVSSELTLQYTRSRLFVWMHGFAFICLFLNRYIELHLPFLLSDHCSYLQLFAFEKLYVISQLCHLAVLP